MPNFPTDYSHLKEIPLAYRQLDEARLPNPAAYKEVLGWLDRIDAYQGIGDFPGDKGIVAFGATGSGKTRSVYKLLAEMKRTRFLERWIAVRATELKQICMDAALGRGQARMALDQIRWAEALFIDDFQQAKFTPRYAEDLFEILEDRTSNNNVTFFTSQLTGEDLLQNVAGGTPELLATAESVVRRIRDFTDPIDFSR